MDIDNRTICCECGKMFIAQGKTDVCPSCQERHYFNCIKKYIDDEKPTVEELSVELHVPTVRIYRWISDGRIQYIPGTGATGLFCEVCGKPISTGCLCVKCAKKRRQRKKKADSVAV